MHRDSTHHYIGTGNEAITISSSAPTSGALQIMFGGTAVGPLPQTIQFPATAESVDLVVTLVGPPGSQCIVSVATVDNVSGGADMTVMLVAPNRTHDTSLFQFVTAAPAVAEFIAAALHA